MKRWAFKSIRHRILALFLSIVLLITVFIIGVTSIITRNQVSTLVEENSLLLVQSHAEMIYSFLQERKREIKDLAESPIVKTMNWDIIEPFLQNQISDLESYYVIFFVAAPDGTYDTTLVRQAGNISDREYFQTVLQGHTTISEPVISKSTGRKSIIIAAPITNDFDQIIGIMGLSLGLVEVYQWVANLRVKHPDSYAFIVDSNGLFVTHPNADLIMTRALEDELPESWHSILQQPSGAVPYTINDSKFKGFFAEIPGTPGWRVIIQVPLDYVEQPVQFLMWRLTGIGIIGVLLVILVGSWFASSISRPIINLKEIFKRGAEGDLTIRADVKSTDEISQTKEYFNRMMDKIGTMTYYDPLTGLPNHEFFLDQLQAALNAQNTIILMLVGVTNFTEVKHVLGTELAQEVLVKTAERIRALDYEHLIAARTADSEFGIMIPALSQDGLQTIMDINDQLRQFLHIGPNNVRVELNVGVAISDEEHLQAQDLMQHAQTALYEAEHSTNGNYRLYDPVTHDALVEKIRLQTELNSAIINQQLTVHYQPVVDLTSGQVVGKEALVRWAHPQRGLLSPGSFIPMAEQSELINEIGAYVLQMACLHHYKWVKKHHRPGWVSVNVSANHFRSPQFPELVQSTLKEYKLPASFLRIEITEDAMLANTADVLRTLTILRDMGIRIAIDDFGTAYSSLEYLTKFAVDTLKIDKTFIDTLDTDPRTEGLVRSMIAMGHNLAMEVIAEGVERCGQLQILQNMGCSAAQGFYFSRPVPWEEYPAVVLETNELFRRQRGGSHGA